ncbi:MAG: cytochrome c3 family protein [Desulfitobacteriaceae bacterium]
MKKFNLITLSSVFLSLILSLSGCGQAVTPPAQQPAPVVTQTATATFVGSEACLVCHKKTNVLKTKHNQSFKPLSAYQLDKPAGTVTVFDGAATPPNSKSTTVDLSKALGVEMDYYVVAEVPKEAGFAKKYYRVAHIVKSGDKWNLVPASKVEGKEDWSAGDYTCGKCHSPGLGAPGKPDLTITCEACHGPGSKHIAATTPAELKSSLVLPDANTCLGCHQSDPTKDAKTGVILATNHYGTRDYSFSKHATGGQINSCFTCHNVHGPNANGLLLKKDNPNDLCVTCHADKKYDVKTIMWDNPSDPYGHITADHSFTALKYEDLGDDEATKTLEITKQPALDIIKAKLPALFK